MKSGKNTWAKGLFKLLVFLVSIVSASSAFSHSIPLVESLKTKVQNLDTSNLQHIIQTTLFATQARLSVALKKAFIAAKNIEYKDVESTVKNLLHEVENADDVLGIHDSGIFEAMIKKA